MIEKKIEEGTVTVDDFNKLIAESLPSSTRERLQRNSRITQGINTSHQDGIGHNTARMRPDARVKHQRSGNNDPMKTARGKMANRRSQRTQARKRMAEAIEFLRKNYGKPIIECDLNVDYKDLLLLAATKLAHKNDWYCDLAAALK